MKLNLFYFLYIRYNYSEKEKIIISYMKSKLINLLNITYNYSRKIISYKYNIFVFVISFILLIIIIGVVSYIYLKKKNNRKTGIFNFNKNQKINYYNNNSDYFDEYNYNDINDNNNSDYFDEYNYNDINDNNNSDYSDENDNNNSDYSDENNYKDENNKNNSHHSTKLLKEENQLKSFDILDFIKIKIQENQNFLKKKQELEFISSLYNNQNFIKLLKLLIKLQQEQNSDLKKNINDLLKDKNLKRLFQINQNNFQKFLKIISIIKDNNKNFFKENFFNFFSFLFEINYFDKNDNNNSDYSDENDNNNSDYSTKILKEENQLKSYEILDFLKEIIQKNQQDKKQEYIYQREFIFDLFYLYNNQNFIKLLNLLIKLQQEQNSDLKKNINDLLKNKNLKRLFQTNQNNFQKFLKIILTIQNNNKNIFKENFFNFFSFLFEINKIKAQQYQSIKYYQYQNKPFY